MCHSSTWELFVLVGDFVLEVNAERRRECERLRGDGRRRQKSCTHTEARSIPLNMLQNMLQYFSGSSFPLKVYRGRNDIFNYFLYLLRFSPSLSFLCFIFSYNTYDIHEITYSRNAFIRTESFDRSKRSLWLMSLRLLKATVIIRPFFVSWITRKWVDTYA